MIFALDGAVKFLLYAVGAAVVLYILWAIVVAVLSIFVFKKAHKSINELSTLNRGFPSSPSSMPRRVTRR